MIGSDIHIHTCYCDGKDTPEELIQKAVEKGYTSIGFSGHSYTEFDDSYCMSQKNTEIYRKTISDLKQKYPQIAIFIGVERDYYSLENETYDYVIGSVHYLKKDDFFLDVDNTAEIMEHNVKKYFDGSYKNYVALYYDTVKKLVEKTKCNIIGHFDLVTKFNEENAYFDEHAMWYKERALETVHALAKSRVMFEVNTGAMARGYRTRPYPAAFILEEIKAIGCDIVLTSDCHDREFLGYGFEQALTYIRACGFKKVKILTENGFCDKFI